MRFPKILFQKFQTVLPLLFGVLLLVASVKFVWDMVHRSQAQKHAELGFIALTAKQYEIAIQEYEAGFLKWQVEETPLGDWTQRIEGLVTWNEKSGAKGIPAVAMPVILLRVDHDQKRLEPIAQAITDDNGRFAFRAPIGIETSIAAMVERAQNVPDLVLSELEKREDQTSDGFN